MTRTRTRKVYLVGAGPGDPELLTVKAVRLLASADVVLHDDLVPGEILALAGPQAKVVNVGKRCGAKGITQDEINERMIRAAHQGLVVVRLKSGDPAVFGRLAEELDALDAAGVPFEIIPGITAGIAAAASLGVSLTDRRTATRVVVVTNHYARENRTLDATDWKSLAREDTTLVIYMPGHEFSGLRNELLAAGLLPDTPAAIVSRASTQSQRVEFATLGDLDTLPRLEPPAILLIGLPLGRSLPHSAEESVVLTLEAAELNIPSR